MRSSDKENYWVNHTIIGYVPLDEDGKPYQPTLGKGWHSRKKPITIYQTLSRAMTYSPCDSAAEVRMFTLQEVTNVQQKN